MPKNKTQELVYALITVLITVPCFVFYCSSYESGGFSVDIIKKSAIYIPIEYVLAYLCEVLFVGKIATKLALKAVNPNENSKILVQTAITCATASIMCPLMSFLATILYNGIIDVGINGLSFNNFLINFIPYWLQKVVLNFPFALLSQLFFIQPLTRTIFNSIFVKESSNKKINDVQAELA